MTEDELKNYLLNLRLIEVKGVYHEKNGFRF